MFRPLLSLALALAVGVGQTGCATGSKSPPDYGPGRRIGIVLKYGSSPLYTAPAKSAAEGMARMPNVLPSGGREAGVLLAVPLVVIELLLAAGYASAGAEAARDADRVREAETALKATLGSRVEEAVRNHLVQVISPQTRHSLLALSGLPTPRMWTRCSSSPPMKCLSGELRHLPPRPA